MRKDRERDSSSIFDHTSQSLGEKPRAEYVYRSEAVHNTSFIGRNLISVFDPSCVWRETGGQDISMSDAQ